MAFIPYPGGFDVWAAFDLSPPLRRSSFISLPYQLGVLSIFSRRIGLVENISITQLSQACGSSHRSHTSRTSRITFETSSNDIFIRL